MKGFFDPESVAVIGVSDRPGNMGQNMFKNLINFGYPGQIYCVGPRGGEIGGHPIYKSVSELPQAPQMAAVLTPKAAVPGIMRELGELGTKRVIIETAGFSELNAQGKNLEKELTSIAAEFGIRFIGPNCIGVISLPSKMAVPFPLLPAVPPLGGVSIISQSGGVALTYVGRLAEQGIGVSRVISVGNKLDVTEDELLEYMIKDPHTETILLYLESIVGGRRMFDLIRKTKKAVVVHKSNVAAVSNAIAQSHTAALANDDAVVDGALEQSGAIRISGFNEGVDVIKGLMLPRADGKRLAVISRSGGHAVAAADEVWRHGMELAQLPQAFLDEVGKHTRASVIKLHNPMDLGDLWDFDFYAHILRGALELDNVDGVMFVLVYRGSETEGARAFLAKAGQLCREFNKPVAMVCLVPAEEIPKAAQASGLPIFRTPEEAMKALAASARVARGMSGEHFSCNLPMDFGRVERVLRATNEKGELELPEALHLLVAAGIEVASFGVAGDPDEAAEMASSLGYPVVVKAVGAGISHKTEQHGVLLNLKRGAHVKKAAQYMMDNLGCTRLVIMSHITGGTEIIVGGKQDHAFGPVVLMGLGGTAAEALQDVSLRLAPVDDHQAGKMLDSLQGAALLKGFRGAAPADRAAILQIIMQASYLISRFPQLKELDLNPVLVGPGGAVAVDARAVVGREE